MTVKAYSPLARSDKCDFVDITLFFNNVPIFRCVKILTWEESKRQCIGEASVEIVAALEEARVGSLVIDVLVKEFAHDVLLNCLGNGFEVVNALAEHMGSIFLPEVLKVRLNFCLHLFRDVLLFVEWRHPDRRDDLKPFVKLFLFVV